ncbi:MAG TPA: helix-turn-helix transcriptional regulator, partial [Clostridia bacterium]|nr:helix-turn-helix transcriptional regulator [Clostridia bacterium]
MSTIGDRIKHYRLMKGLKQKDIYEKIGIDKSTYIRYESKAVAGLELELCNKICNAIGIEPELVYDEYLSFIASDYGTTIRDFREKHKLTHKKFGTLIGIHPKVTGRWEKGKSKPTRASYE